VNHRVNWSIQTIWLWGSSDNLADGPKYGFPRRLLLWSSIFLGPAWRLRGPRFGNIEGSPPSHPFIFFSQSSLSGFLISHSFFFALRFLCDRTTPPSRLLPPYPSDDSLCSQSVHEDRRERLFLMISFLDPPSHLPPPTAKSVAIGPPFVLYNPSSFSSWRLEICRLF